MGAQPSVFPHSTSSKGFKVGEALRSGRFPPMRREGGVDAFSLDRASLLQLLESFDIQRRAEKLRDSQEREEKLKREANSSNSGTIELPREKCRSCVRRLCDAQVMRKDALYFRREMESLVSELNRIFDEGGRRALSNFVSFSSAKLSPQEMKAASPYPPKPGINERWRCSACKKAEAERDEAHTAACVACYQLEGICAFVEAHSERIQAAAALHAAQYSNSSSIPSSRRPRRPLAGAAPPAAAGAAAAPSTRSAPYAGGNAQQRASSICGPQAYLSTCSSTNVNSSRSCNTIREGLRVRRAETESVTAVWSREGGGSGEAAASRRASSRYPAAAATRQPLSAALLLLSAPFTQYPPNFGKDQGPPALSRNRSLVPNSVSGSAAASGTGWNRAASVVSVKDAVRAPASAAVSSLMIPRLPCSPSAHS